MHDIETVIFFRALVIQQASNRINIGHLLQMEAEMKNSAAGAPTCPERDAKMNLLKYRQIGAVQEFEQDYDDLYYTLGKDGKLDILRCAIIPDRSKACIQPKVAELQQPNGNSLAEQLHFYLADAQIAKQHLDKLVTEVVEDLDGCEVHQAGVKSLESTERKAIESYNEDVRRVTDMARVSVVCDEAEQLELVYLGILKHLKVSSEFMYSHGPTLNLDLDL